MEPSRRTTIGVRRAHYHPWTPTVLLLVVAVGAAAATALSNGSAVIVLWWMLVGLVSGYAISGSV
ncbi:hypothetical protein Rhe02_34010 [Rhizocola hellebori]|uniref:Uncharacterized protein n=1 Tax=Rhizocola hellebori TaxID=1392758 RepID=A0A8J3VFG2_9ACTN|nr:hypothetical protein [Rhizocola hellebori]GIH05334.1 hypothetical protein Rhe02_34010 [Rhizocola hellebori]